MSARILVVDDVPANVKLLEARLSAEYFDVLTAANGEEALATLQQYGGDIGARCRRDSAGRQIPAPGGSGPGWDGDRL